MQAAVTATDNKACWMIDRVYRFILFLLGEDIRTQPRSQVLSPTRRETLVGSGHVSPRIWEITNKRLGGGADKCEICLYEA